MINVKRTIAAQTATNILLRGGQCPRDDVLLARFHYVASSDDGTLDHAYHLSHAHYVLLPQCRAHTMHLELTAISNPTCEIIYIHI